MPTTTSIARGKASGVENTLSPEAAYRRFVDGGVDKPFQNPLARAIDGWLVGSRQFAQRIKNRMKSPQYADEVPAARRLNSIPLSEEVEEVLENPDGVETSRSSGRPIAFGETSTGRIIAVVYEEIDKGTVYPVTAFEVG